MTFLAFPFFHLMPPSFTTNATFPSMMKTKVSRRISMICKCDIPSTFLVIMPLTFAIQSIAVYDDLIWRNFLLCRDSSVIPERQVDSSRYLFLVTNSCLDNHTNLEARPPQNHAHRKSAMLLVIGASPEMGGLRGSSSGGSAIDCRVAGEGKNELLGNSTTLGEKSAGVGGVSTSDPPKLREKF